MTLNDSLGHAGANHFQNFPVLSAAHCGSATGTLNSVPNTRFRIEFFANRQPDPSGYGEGERYIGFIEVTTDAAGNAGFDVPLAALAGGEYLTATATNQATGDTSEFSRAVLVEPPPVAAVTGPAAGVRGQPLAFTLTAAGSAGPFTFAIDWDGRPDGDRLVRHRRPARLHGHRLVHYPGDGR